MRDGVVLGPVASSLSYTVVILMFAYDWYSNWLTVSSAEIFIFLIFVCIRS